MFSYLEELLKNQNIVDNYAEVPDLINGKLNFKIYLKAYRHSTKRFSFSKKITYWYF